MIKQVSYIKDYILKVLFDDGEVRNIDLFPFMSSSKNSTIRKFLDKKLFRKFYFNDWGLCWGDNEFDINPLSIYRGEFNLK